MELPDFLIVGAQKCGTTTLYDILNNHPEVNMSKIKEVNYFTMLKDHNKGLDFYSKFFNKKTTQHKVTGEASPGYMSHLKIPKLIKDNLGEVKVVMILRNPIKRAYSQYWDNRRHLSEHLDMNEIIDQYLTDTYSANSRGYFSRGIYIKYINEYLKFFKRDKLHIIILEELVENPTEELKKLYDFIGIDSSIEYLKFRKQSNSSMIWKNPFYLFLLKNPFYSKWINKHLRRLFFFGKRTNYKYSLPSDVKLEMLKEFYAPWNDELEIFLNRKIKSWRI